MGLRHLHAVSARHLVPPGGAPHRLAAVGVYFTLTADAEAGEAVKAGEAGQSGEAGEAGEAREPGVAEDAEEAGDAGDAEEAGGAREAAVVYTSEAGPPHGVPLAAEPDCLTIVSTHTRHSLVPGRRLIPFAAQISPNHWQVSSKMLKLSWKGELVSGPGARLWRAH